MALTRLERLGNIRQWGEPLFPTTTAGVILHTREQIAQPSAGYFVDVNQYAIASYSPDKPWLLTQGLITCKAVSFARPEEKRALLVHLHNSVDSSRLLDLFERELGMPLSQTDASILSGYYGHPQTVRTKLASRFCYENSIPFSELLSAVADRHPRTLTIDDSKGKSQQRGAAVNLWTGKIYELRHDQGWLPWHQYDTRQSKSISQEPL